MDFKKEFDRLTQKYGRTVTLTRGEETLQLRAFIQPLRDSSPAETGEGTYFGVKNREEALYIAPLHPGERPPQRGDFLTVGQEQYQVRKQSILTLGEEPFYCRALLEKVKEGGEACPSL